MLAQVCDTYHTSVNTRIISSIRTAGSATLPKWIYSQGAYFESKTGGEVKIFGFYKKAKMKKKEAENNR